MFDLATVCPRLARAHRARQAELREEELERQRLVHEVVRLRALVAHRDLQYLRAAAKPGRSHSLRAYVRQRKRMLDEATAALARAERRARKAKVKV